MTIRWGTVASVENRVLVHPVDDPGASVLVTLQRPPAELRAVAVVPVVGDVIAYTPVLDDAHGIACPAVRP